MQNNFFTKSCKIDLTKFLVKLLMDVNSQNLMEVSQLVKKQYYVKTPDEGKFTLPLKYWGQLD